MSGPQFEARLLVRLQAGVNDPQGLTVRGSLRAIGHEGVSAVRVGKVIDIAFEAADEEEARARVNRMCQDLLVNPVIETVEVDLREHTEVGG